MAAIFVGAVLVAAVAFFGGRELRAEPQESASAFDTDAPSYFTTPLPIVDSLAGFNGAGLLDGRPVFSGSISSVNDSTVTIATPYGAIEIDISGNEKLWQLGEYDGQIDVGDEIVVRRDGDIAVALLLLDR